MESKGGILEMSILQRVIKLVKSNKELCIIVIVLLVAATSAGYYFYFYNDTRSEAQASKELRCGEFKWSPKEGF